MIQQVLLLSKKLIRIHSTSENIQQLQQCLDLIEKKLHGFTIERFTCNGYPSLLIYPSSKRPKKFTILLNGHVDVIPGKENQYKPKMYNDNLYGTGALDMKTNLATFIEVFIHTAHSVSYPLGLQITTDEELGGFFGTKHQIESGVRADFVITGETTNFDIVHKTKGILWLKISSKGKSAHGAYTWNGENAIWKMNKFLNKLYTMYPPLSSEKYITTINVSKILTSNIALNKIPDDCSVYLDIRYIYEDRNKILSRIKSLLTDEFSIEILTNEPASYVTKENTYIKKLASITKKHCGREIKIRGAHGSSDVRHYIPYDITGVEFGPIGDGIGSDKEYINITSVNKYYDIVIEFLLSIDKI